MRPSSYAAMRLFARDGDRSGGRQKIAGKKICRLLAMIGSVDVAHALKMPPANTPRKETPHDESWPDNSRI